MAVKKARSYSKKKTSSVGSKSFTKRKKTVSKKLPLKQFKAAIGRRFQTKELVEDEVDTSSKAKGRRGGL